MTFSKERQFSRACLARLSFPNKNKGRTTDSLTCTMRVCQPSKVVELVEIRDKFYLGPSVSQLGLPTVDVVNIASSNSVTCICQNEFLNFLKFIA